MKISLEISPLFTINRTALKILIRKCVNKVMSFGFLHLYPEISTDMNDSVNLMVVPMLPARWRS